MTGRSLLDRPGGRGGRRGFTLGECAIALAALATISVMVAELATRMLSDRARIEARAEGTQVGANILEQAWALSWDGLTSEWAGGRKVPDHVLQRWPDARLAVRVEAEPNRPRVKRVTVELRWGDDRPTSWPPVVLTALFAARTAGGGS
ncbi:MAG: hypothetical protein JWO38_3974 [Gemmataceae bacterium]|nr:hypothetical protein [Gemmataceae bacterium]